MLRSPAIIGLTMAAIGCVGIGHALTQLDPSSRQDLYSFAYYTSTVVPPAPSTTTTPPPADAYEREVTTAAAAIHCYEDEAWVPTASAGQPGARRCMNLEEMYAPAPVPDGFDPADTLPTPCADDEMGVVTIDHDPAHGLAWGCVQVPAAFVYPPDTTPAAR